MKKTVIILFVLTLFFIPSVVNANFKPTTIKDKDDLVYFIRYYSGSKSTVEGKTIKLEKDLYLGKNSINFNLKKSIIFDINGHKIITKGNNPCIVLNGDKKLLTIINSKNDNGYLKSNYNTIIASSGNLVINNLNIISNSKKHNGLFETGGKIKLVNSSIVSKNNAINVKFGFLQSDSGSYKGDRYGIKIDGGKVLINDGVFIGKDSGLNLNDYNALRLKKGNFKTSNKEKNTHSVFKYVTNNLFISRFAYLYR